YKTVNANKATVNKEWVLVDAEGETLGRLASRVAYLLRGKNKVNFTPNVDCGDNVIIINAEKIKISGTKEEDKVYVHYTGYPGGQRFATPKELLKKNPTAIIEKAVKKMLPRTRLGRAIYGNLHVYAGSSHPHEAQQPKKIDIKSVIK
ncbi:MAG: 50S ribosomal protein L13, partial [Bacteroidia bacterium]